MKTQGKAFYKVFYRPPRTEPDTWRIRHSGVQGQPQTSMETSAVLDACTALGIEVTHSSSGSAVNANSYKVHTVFLDGGLEGMTGNYWYGPRGVWVKGRKAVLLIALQLGLTVQRRWYHENGLTEVTLDSLKKELVAGNSGTPQATTAGSRS